MKLTFNSPYLAAIALLVSLTIGSSAVAQDDQTEAAYERALEQAEQERVLAEDSLQRARAELQEKQREIVVQERERAVHGEERRRELVEMREELSRAHRQLRETQREISRVHREIAREQGSNTRFSYQFVDERPVVGIVLGNEKDGGVEVLGVSPDGPSERAGLQQGDLIIGMNGTSLSSDSEDETPRAVIHRVMGEVEADQEMEIEVLRDGSVLAFSVTPERRKPLVWESIAPLPSSPEGVAAIAMAPSVHVERIVIPEIDEDEIAAQMENLTREVQRFDFVSPNITVDVVSPDAPDAPVAYSFSSIGGEALHEANLWFGLPLTTGVKLAALNEGLGEYFGIDYGVLVLSTSEHSRLELEPGDVILSINGAAVEQPGDVFRVLRRHIPGDMLTLEVQRRQELHVIETEMPEPRAPQDLGFTWIPKPFLEYPGD